MLTVSTRAISLDINLEGAHNFWQKLAQKIQELSLTGKKVAAGVLLTATAIVATGCGSDVEAKPTPSVSETVEPSESETPSETPKTPELTFEQKVEAYEIPEGLSTEELAKTILDKLTLWTNAGTEQGEKLLDDSMAANLSWSEFLPPVAQEESKAPIKALLPEGWQDDDNLVRFVNNMTRVNYETLLAFVETNWHEKSSEGYRRWDEFESVTEINKADNYLQLQIDYTMKSNHNKNPIDEAAEGYPETFTVGISVVNGHIKIVDAEFKSR